MKIEIEKGIPIPEKLNKKRLYPWRNMEVGDSFFVRKSVKTMTPSSYAAGNKHGMKFAVRAEGEGARVWRIK